MKPPLFHVGQAVVCVTPIWNQVAGQRIDARLPAKDRIYTVSLVQYWKQIKGYAISLEECGIENGFNERDFTPAELVSDEALAELLEEVFTPVNA